MILGICDNPDILNVMRIIDIVITIIKIVVPILLIISGMITYMNAVKDNEAISKTNNLFVRKIIAAVLIFFIPTFVNIIAKMTEGSLEYSSCITNATPEGISGAYRKNADIYVNRAVNSLKESDYNVAKDYINNISNENDRNELNNKLNTLNEFFEINKKLDDLKSKFDSKTYEEILVQINNITDSSMKEKLLSKYNDIHHYVKTDTTEENGNLVHVNGYNGLKFYLYNQCSGGWRNMRIGIGTFCEGGCGLTTQTVLISAYKPSVKPYDSISFGDDYNHDKVIEKETNNSYDCTKYDDDKVNTNQIIDALKNGSVVSVKVWGSSKGGKSKFTGSQHFMSLIDYYNDEIFIGNAFNPSFEYGNYGWYKACDVLTSVQSAVICKPLK